MSQAKKLVDQLTNIGLPIKESSSELSDIESFKSLASLLKLQVSNPDGYLVASISDYNADPHDPVPLLIIGEFGHKDYHIYFPVGLLSRAELDALQERIKNQGSLSYPNFLPSHISDNNLVDINLWNKTHPDDLLTIIAPFLTKAIKRYRAFVKVAKMVEKALQKQVKLPKTLRFYVRASVTFTLFVHVKLANSSSDDIPFSFTVSVDKRQPLKFDLMLFYNNDYRVNQFRDIFPKLYDSNGRLLKKTCGKISGARFSSIIVNFIEVLVAEVQLNDFNAEQLVKLVACFLDRELS